MSSTAIMLHILPGMTPRVIEFTEEIKSRRQADHDASRKNLGIKVEKAFVENTNEGDVLILYFEGAHLKRSLKEMGESEQAYDLWFRDRLLELTTTDTRDSLVFKPSALVFESPAYEPEVPVTSTATVFPILPSKKESWMSLLNELHGPRDEEYRGYLWRYNITLEKMFVQQSPKGEIVILYIEAEDPAQAISRFARSHHPFDVWYREEMLYLNGIDFIRRQTAPPPHILLDWKAGIKKQAA